MLLTATSSSFDSKPLKLWARLRAQKLVALPHVISELPTDTESVHAWGSLNKAVPDKHLTNCLFAIGVRSLKS